MGRLTRSDHPTSPALLSALFPHTLRPGPRLTQLVALRSPGLGDCTHVELRVRKWDVKAPSNATPTQ